MPRLPKGLYHDGAGTISYAGYRKPTDPPGLTWETVTNTEARDLLRGAGLADLEWSGTTVVRRPQSNIDARLQAEAIAADDARFEREQDKAVLSLLLDEINILRVRAGLAARTIEQAKNAYEAKLNR